MTAGAAYHPPMFLFFSNRLGWLGSIAVSIVATGIVILILRGCSH